VVDGALLNKDGQAGQIIQDEPETVEEQGKRKEAASSPKKGRLPLSFELFKKRV